MHCRILQGKHPWHVSVEGQRGHYPRPRALLPPSQHATQPAAAAASSHPTVQRPQRRFRCSPSWRMRCRRARPTHFVAIHLKSREIQRCVFASQILRCSLFSCLLALWEPLLGSSCSSGLSHKTSSSSAAWCSCSLRASAVVSGHVSVGSHQASSHSPSAYFLRGRIAVRSSKSECKRKRCFGLRASGIQEPRLSEARQVVSQARVCDFHGSVVAAHERGVHVTVVGNLERLACSKKSRKLA